MKLTLISLDRIELLEDLLSALVEIGITDANVIEASALGHIITEKIPIFAGLMNGFTGTSPVRKIIIFNIDNNVKKKILELVTDICSDEDSDRSTTVIFLPIDEIVSVK